MLKAGVKPDVVTYNTLIGMLRIEGDDVPAKKRGRGNEEGEVHAT